MKLNKHETSQFIALAAAVHSARNEDTSAAAHQHSYGAAERKQLQAVQEARQRHHLDATAHVSASTAEAEEEGLDEEEYFSDGETEDLVVVLGGPKGHAYQVSLNVSDLLTATITPLDKHNKLENGKAVVVR